MVTDKDKLYNGIVPKNDNLIAGDYGRVHCSNPEPMTVQLHKRLLEKLSEK